MTRVQWLVVVAAAALILGAMLIEAGDPEPWPPFYTQPEVRGEPA